MIPQSGNIENHFYPTTLIISRLVLYTQFLVDNLTYRLGWGYGQSSWTILVEFLIVLCFTPYRQYPIHATFLRFTIIRAEPGQNLQPITGSGEVSI